MMLEELYYTFYYIWINPTAWSLMVVFILCALLGYSLSVVTCGLWQIIGLCLYSIFLLGVIVVCAIHSIQAICGISPMLLSEFDYIAQESWMDNVVFGLIGLAIGTVTDTMMVIRD